MADQDRHVQRDFSRAVVSRRALLGAGSLAAATAAFGADLIFAPPAFATAGSLAAAQADADVNVGKQRTEGTWGTWNGGPPAAWCAYFVSWLMRATPDAYATNSSTAFYDHYAALGRVGTTPRPGAISIYSNNAQRSGIQHTGWVRDTTNGLHLIEGNVGFDPALVKKYNSHWVYDGIKFWTYLYPTYVGYDSMTGVGNPGTAGDMPTAFTYTRTDDTSIGTLTETGMDTFTGAWTTLPIVDGSTTATNIAEYPGGPTGSIYQLTITLDFVVPAGFATPGSVIVRTVYQDKTTSQKATVTHNAIPVTGSGHFRAQHSSLVRLDGSGGRTASSHRVLVEAGASSSGVVIDRLRIDELVW